MWIVFAITPLHHLVAGNVRPKADVEGKEVETIDPNSALRSSGEGQLGEGRNEIGFVAG